jgi:hypothetical protein
MGSASKLREGSEKNYRPTPKDFREIGESTHGEGRHHVHKVGDRISYRAPSGRKQGTVVSVHKEYYYVRNGKNITKVNRNSILYALGTFLGGARQKIENTKKAYEYGKEKENERLEKFKAQYGKYKARPKLIPKKINKKVKPKK